MIDSMYQEQTEKVLQDRVDRPLPERIVEPSNTWGLPNLGQTIKFASDYYGVLVAIPVIFLIIWARKKLRQVNFERLSVPRQIALWTCLTLAATFIVGFIFGPKAASYTGGGMAVAAFFRVRESIPDKDE